MVDDGKYGPLARLLIQAAERGEARVYLSFAEVDELVGGLPPEAYVTKGKWWTATRTPQAVAWTKAGWRVEGVGSAMQRVAFANSGTPSR